MTGPDNLDQRMTDAGIPPRFRSARVADLTGPLEAFARCHLHDKAREGVGVWLFGAYGCGKTHALAAFAAHLLQAGLRVEWADWFWLFRALRSLGDYGATAAQALQVSRTAPILFLDDFGKPGDVQRETALLFEIVNHRYNHRLPTFFSCNAGPDQLFGPGRGNPDPAGAIWDRFGECVEAVGMKETSRRRAAA